MRTETTTREIYTFDELTDDGKQSAIDKYREHNLDYEWWDHTFDDAKTIGGLMGIDIDNIYFSGFANQGDGACFEGDYSYKVGSVKAVKSYAPLDKTLHQIAIDLSKVQRPSFYQLSASVKHSGHYHHELCTQIDVCDDSLDYAYPVSEDQIEGVKEGLRDFMCWIYKQLENESDYMQSEKTITEALQCEYEFNIDGTMA